MPSAVEEVWLRQLWERTSDAMALSDATGSVLAANPAYYRLYGYAPEDVLGASFALIFPPERRAWAEAQYQEIFWNEQPPPVVRSSVRSKDGTERVVESRVSFLERDGRRTAMLSIIRDVTEQVAAERAATRAENNLRSVLFSLSHDIKSPLAVIRGHAQVLRRHMVRHSAVPSFERLRDGLAQIETSTDDVAALLDELLELAMLEDGATLPLQPTSFDLVELIRRTVERHRRLADEHDFVLELGADALQGVWDQRRLARVIDNLLSNAVKYSPGGGTITVELRPRVRQADPVNGSSLRPGPSSDGVLIAVEDNGIGIEAHDLPRVFERFHRGGNVPETAVGSGIGLTSVDHIVRQHGGTVTISSQAGAGTRVSIWLPDRVPEDRTGAT